MSKGNKYVGLGILLFFLLSVLGMYNASLRPDVPVEMLQRQGKIEVILPASAPSGTPVTKNLHRLSGFPVNSLPQVEEVLVRHAIGDSVDLVFEDNTVLTLPLVAHYSTGRLFLSLGVGFFFFVLGALVWYRSTRREDLLFSLSAFLFGYIIIMHWGGMLLPLPISLPLASLYFLSYPFAFLTFLLFSYYFPSGVLSPRQMRWRIRIIVLLGISFSLLLLFTFFRKFFFFSLDTVRQYHSLYRAFRAFMLIVLVLALFNLIRSWLRHPDAENRRKIQWVLWGVFWGSFPFVFLWNLPQIFGLAPLVPEWVTNLAVLFVPTTIAIAILRHRLFDIEIVVSRSLVYSIVLLSLIAVYLLTASGFSLVLINQFSLNSPIASILAALVVALLFQPLKNRVQTQVDRRFYRIKYDRFQAMKAFLRELENVNESFLVVKKLQAAYQRAVPVRRQEVVRWGKSPEGEHPGKLPGDANFLRWVEAQDYGSREHIFVNSARRSRIESGLELPAAPLPEPYLLFLFIDSHTGWLIGEKRSGQRFWKEDLDLARQMATAAATQLEKIRYLKKYIQESLEREKAQQLSEWKSLLVAEVAHDLRSPLNTILWKLKNLQYSLSAGGENWQQATREIQSQVQRLQQLIQSLLSFSSIERGQMPLRLVPLSLRTLLQEALEALQEAIARKHLQVEQEVPAALAVRSDALFLREVLFNILHNAVKFSPEGERIRITARQFREEGGEEMVEIRVQDRAGGMTPEQITAAFEPFGKKEQSGAAGGFHLGLHIVKQFTELLKGKVRIESQPGEGTTVVLHFPAANLHPAKGKENHESPHFNH